MLDILYSTEAQIVMLLWALAVMGFAGFYLVRRFRDFTDDDTPGANELLTNFRELHLRGDLEEEEYRKIKTRMSDQLKQEINDSDNKD